MLTVRLVIRETPPDHRGGYDLARDEVSAQAVDYETGLEAARAQVPEGWQVLSIDVERPGAR